MSLVRDRLQELSEELSTALQKGDIPKAQTVAVSIAAESEKNALLLKQITDIARFGYVTPRTQRWAAVMETTPGEN